MTLNYRGQKYDTSAVGGQSKQCHSGIYRGVSTNFCELERAGARNPHALKYRGATYAA